MSQSASIFMGFLQDPDVVLGNGTKKEYFLRSDRQRSAINQRPRIELTNAITRHPVRKSIFIGDLGDARLTLNALLPIHLERAGKQVLGYSYDLDELEVAEDEYLVIEGMKASIVDLYFMLKDEQGQLGPIPLRQWNYLRNVISEV